MCSLLLSFPPVPAACLVELRHKQLLVGFNSSFDYLLTLISITDDIEKSEISTTFDAVMLESLLMGMYTTVYTGTMYIYTTKTTSRHLIVAAAVTILYLCSLLKLGLAWYSSKHALIDHGDSRDSIFLALYDGLHFFIVNYVNVIIATIAGDGLLIWRCFNLWGRPYRIITMPIFLVVLEAALLIAGIAGGALASSVASMDIFDNLIAAGLITSASNTIMATALIAYLSSFLTLQIFFARKFQHIVDIIIQSGAVYSLSLLVYGVSVVFVGPSFSSPWRYAFNAWTQNLIYIAGLSTSKLVARFAMISDSHSKNIPTLTHISGLQFQPDSTMSSTSSEVRATAAVSSFNDDAANMEEKSYRTV